MKNWFIKILAVVIISWAISCKEEEEQLLPTVALTNFTATAGITSATLAWVKPEGAVQSYIITYAPGDKSILINSSEQTTARIEGLLPEVEYTFTATWINSSAKVSMPVTSTATPLRAPTLIFSGDLVLPGQSSIDTLSKSYTHVSGKVIIGQAGSTVRDLSKLVSLREISGELAIKDNNALASLAGLEELIKVGGNLTVANNGGLINLCAFQKLTAANGVSGSVTITGNSHNPTLAQIASGSCKSGEVVYAGDLSLTSQQEVNAITKKYTRITGRLKIGNYVAGGSNITDLSILSNVRSVDFLEVDGNNLLVDLSGLGALDSIRTGNLTIRDNLKIQSLKGLRLRYMRNDIAILNNPVLQSLTGLENLEKADEIFIGKEGFNGPTGAEKPNPTLTDYCALATVVTMNFTAISANRSMIQANAFNPTFQQIKDGACKGTLATEVVLDAGLRVNTQQEVDAVAEMYTEITGELVIGLTAAGNDIRDLSKFSRLKKIGGRLLIQRNNLLTDLSGLKALESVGMRAGFDVGELIIRENPLLTSLQGLEKLKEIGDDFAVLENANLTSLTGVENLKTLQNRLWIGYQGWTGANGTVKPNPLLTNYCALSGIVQLKTIAALSAQGSGINNGTFFSPSFQDILDGKCQEGKGLVLETGLRVNTQAEVDALPVYAEIKGELVIGLTLATNNITNLSKFSKLTKVGGRLLIQQNKLLTDLSGLQSLTSVGEIAGFNVGELIIRQNPALTSLQGLEKLTFVADDFGVLDNAALTTLNGVQNLADVKNRIFIGYQGWQGLSGDVKPNPSLTNYCALTKVITALTPEALAARECTINNGTFYSPSFTNIRDGSCSK